jgi:hypothetical protein
MSAMAWSIISAKLDSFLRGRAAFCIVFRVIPQKTGEPELEFMGGGTAFGEKLEALAAKVKHAALMHFMAKKSVITDHPDPAGTKHPSGKIYWIAIIATGETRDAGYIVVMRVWATSRAAVETYVEGVQAIMRGEDLESLPNPE